MIEIKQLEKQYVSKGGKVISALNGVDISLPPVGMIFVVGKSGCGKTTLLNIIGGLDSPTQGKVSYNNKTINYADSKFLDEYRKEYIGFVFQEYNLIENQTIFENVQLAAKLCNYEDSDTQNAIEQVGLDEFSSHLANEISGGQKQRVALARAIVKKSPIILADEPTGNLDSNTAEEIFLLLKDLSKNHLVVVVTHDEEFSQLYGDRIIKLADGNVISDRVINEIDCIFSHHQKSTTLENMNNSSKFPFKEIVKRGMKNLNYKKGRTVLTIILLFLSVSVMLWSQMFVVTNSEKIMSRTLHENGGTKTFLYQETYLDTGAIPSGSIYYGTPGISRNSLEYISSITKPYVCGVLGFGITNNVITIDNKNEIAQAGFELYDGALEIEKPNYIYLSDYSVDRYFRLEETDMSNYSQYIGQDIVFYSAGTSNSYAVLAGVIKTDYRQYFYWNPQTNVATLKSNLTQAEEKKGVFVQKTSEIAFLTVDFILDVKQGSYKYNSKSFVATENGTKVFDAYTLNCSTADKTVGISEVFSISSSSVSCMTAEGKIEYYPRDGEVVLSYDLYKLIFETDYISGEFPKYLGKKINLNLTEYNVSEVLAKADGLILKGVTSDSLYERYDIHINPNNSKDLKKYALYHQSFVIVDISQLTSGQLKSFFATLRNDYEIAAINTMSTSVYYNEELFTRTFFILGTISIIMFAISLLLVANLMSILIDGKFREIGILRAMGMSEKNIVKIYLMKIVFISLIAFLFSNLCILGLINLTNIAFSGPTDLIFAWIAYDVLSVIASVLCTIIFPILVALLPLRKINNMNPVDAIKS